MKIKSLLEEGAVFLDDKGNSILNSEVLLAYILGVERQYLISNYDQDVGESLVDLYMEYLNRVKEGEPVAYITGEKEFYGINFYVDNRVLIPRPETEQLVDKVIRYIKENSDGVSKFRVLDAGTGSGNIAVSIAYSLDRNLDLIDRIDAIDLDEGALEVSKINAQQYSVEDKVYVYQSDLLDNIEDRSKFDIIVVNLPYIGEEKNRFVSSDSEKYEPHCALFGGKDGLVLYKKLFQQINEKKIDYKVIFGEFGFSQRKDMERLLNKYFDQNWAIEKDLAGIDRIFIIKK